MLTLRDVTLRLGDRLLLDRASAQIGPGRRIGLVGRNGAGKSTLLRLIAGELTPDGGDIRLSARNRIGRVEQHAPRGEQTPTEVVLAADRERADLLAEAERATDPHRIAEIHTRLADIGAHAAPARAATILAGLGFDAAAQERPLASFSGGWRMRVALAAALFAEPDLLLLDEPTNHLDLEAAMWLEGFLARYPHSLLLVSHDRTLLNSAVDGILHLDGGGLTLYRGTYDRFERTRRERLAQQQEAQKRQTAERQRIQAFVDRFRAKATKARQAQSRIKLLEKMQLVALPPDDPTVTFSFPGPEPLSPPILALDGVSVGYEAGNPVLRNLDLRIDTDDRIGLLGQNGNGKTTLLRLLSGQLAAMSGQVTRASKLRVGYFAQDQLDLLEPDATAYATIAWRMPEASETAIRGHLGRFGFSQSKADLRVAVLSGGERARLVLAGICTDAPQLLLLDEPTNHLDMEAREELLRALNAYSGAVVLVTHDLHMLSLTADRLWLVAGGACQPYDGDLDSYRRLLLEQRGSAAKTAAMSGANGGASPSKQQMRRERAQARAAIAHLSRTVRDAEAHMERLAAERRRIDAVLADPKLYTETPDQVATLSRRKAEIERDFAAAEEAWIEAQTRIEESLTET